MAGDVPDPLEAGGVGAAGDLLGIGADPAPADELDVLHHVQLDAIGVVDKTIGVAEGHHLGP